MNGKWAREVAIRIVDEFEELLAEKDVMIPSADREGGEEAACLYGSEYYPQEDAITEILMEETRKRARGSRRMLGAEDAVPEAGVSLWAKFTCAPSHFALC